MNAKKCQIGGGNNFLLIYKNNGKFYNAYDNDAYILSGIMGYKVVNGRKCGFPDNALDKVINRLEDNKISYQIIYTNNKPVIKDYKKLNNYDKFYKKSLETMEIQNKVDIIVDKIKNASNEDLMKILESLLNV